MRETPVHLLPGSAGVSAMTTNASRLRRAHFAPAALALVIGLLFALSIRPAYANKDAEAFVQHAANDVMDVINNTSLSHRQKKQRIGDIVDEYVDSDAIADFSLGRHRRSATPHELDEFHQLFRDYITNYYVENLSNFEGATLKVTGSHSLGGRKGTIVTSVARAQDTDETEIDWRVRDSQIIDVRIANFWMALTLREQLDDVISRHGGRVSAAIDRLREMAQTS
jgi:phospholipid transport system substrate-binding protein